MKPSILEKNFLSLENVLQAIPELNTYCENTNYPFFKGNLSYKKIYNLSVFLFKTCIPHPSIDEIQSDISRLSSGVLDQILYSCNLKKRKSAPAKSYIPSNYVIQYPGIATGLLKILANPELKQKIVINLEKEFCQQNKNLQEIIQELKKLLDIPEFKDHVYSKIEGYLHQALNSQNTLRIAYSILIFIVFSVSHERMPDSILNDDFIDQISNHEQENSMFSMHNNFNIEHQFLPNTYDNLFVHEQYKKFFVYLYNDTGNYTSDFCSGEIHFSENGDVTLNFQNEKSTRATQYSGKAYLFTANNLVHITLEDEATHRGALICFHYTDFKNEPKKCFLRKGLFISTGAADEHYRPFVKNIVLLHKEPTQQEFVSGLLKCCNMRNGNEFIIIHKDAVTHFIDRLYEFDFMLPLSGLKSSFQDFFSPHEHNNYCLFKENDFLNFLRDSFKSSLSLNEWNHIEIILLLKSFSELPNAIYPYATPDSTFHIFL